MGLFKRAASAESLRDWQEAGMCNDAQIEAAQAAPD